MIKDLLGLVWGSSGLISRAEALSRDALGPLRTMGWEVQELGAYGLGSSPTPLTQTLPRCTTHTPPAWRDLTLTSAP